MRFDSIFIKQFFFFCAILFSYNIVWANNDDDVLEQKVMLKKGANSKYELIKSISEQSGYFFIYESNVIKNDEIIHISKNEETKLREAIFFIAGNDQISIKTRNRHIILSISDKNETDTYHLQNTKKDTEKQAYTINGKLFDRTTNEAIAFASVYLSELPIGTVTNQEGDFSLNIPKSDLSRSICFSHIGYFNEEFNLDLLSENHYHFSLEPKIIPLQELVVKAIDPLLIFSKMQEHKDLNYYEKAINQVVFYREGINKRESAIDLTEGVLEIYKTAFSSSRNDQAKLIKMRRITSKENNDTIFTKLKSGISACLELDIIKNPPEFIDATNTSYFNYRFCDLTSIDNRPIYVICFEPKYKLEKAHFVGELYIDAENYALVKAVFGLNPKYAEDATSLFVIKKSRNLNIKLQNLEYSVHYKQNNDGKYYVNHIRGDLFFKVKKKKKLFSTQINPWFEMVCCKIESENASSFPMKERFSVTNIFSETMYPYDVDFWKNFNVILPERELKELIINNLNNVSLEE